MTARGLFLDLDGTLADSHAMLARQYARLVRTVGATEAPPFARAAALTLPQIVDALTADRDDVDRTALLADYERGVLEDYVHVPAREGAYELLRLARGAGWRTAVVTSASESLSRAWLQARGLFGLLDVLVGRESVSRSKPRPEPYLYAIRACGCDADTSLAVEDSRSGAQAAIDAGLTTYALAPAADDWPPVAGFVGGLFDVQALLP